jgi:hypothetical protein
MPESMMELVMQFSAQTSSNKVQEIIESNVEKRTKDTFAPPAGKHMVIFIDDMNMPQVMYACMCVCMYVMCVVGMYLRCEHVMSSDGAFCF